MLPTLQRPGQQKSIEGRQAEQRGGPSAPPHGRQSSAARRIRHPSPSVPPFTASSQDVPRDAASPAKRGVFVFIYFQAKCQASICSLVVTESQTVPACPCSEEPAAVNLNPH